MEIMKGKGILITMIGIGRELVHRGAKINSKD